MAAVNTLHGNIKYDQDNKVLYPIDISYRH